MSLTINHSAASSASAFNLLKPSVWDYSIKEICGLEDALHNLKMQEGKQGENYRKFKAEVDKIREANLPFRSYMMWKKNTVDSFNFDGPKSGDKEYRARKKTEWLQNASQPGVEKKLHLLSRLTFLHGSNSAALAIMMLSNEPKLQCTGQLAAQGIAPMSGELGTGVGPGGVNDIKISAETVRGIERVLGYAGQFFSFNPDQLAYFFNPFSDIVKQEFGNLDHFIARLLTWRCKDREGFNDLLDMPKRVQLMEALENEVENQLKLLERKVQEEQRSLQNWRPDPLLQSKEEYQHRCQQEREEISQKIVLLQRLMRVLRNEEEWTDQFKPCDYNELRQWIINPYTYKNSIRENAWFHIGLHAQQLRQWDWPAFEQHVLPFSGQWLQALAHEKLAKEKPLRTLIAMIDHEFTADEKRFLTYRDKGLSSSMVIPDSLASIFPSLEDIPRPGFLSSFEEDAVKQNIYCCRQGVSSWNELLDRVLTAKLYPSQPSMWNVFDMFNAGCRILGLAHMVQARSGELNTQNHLNQLKSIFEQELSAIERNYNLVSDALASSEPPRIQIPEHLRSLVTKPLPVIFASTVVKPMPSNPHYAPDEYTVDHSVPLGQDGCNLLFTDTEESRETIRQLLPQLEKEMDIRLFSELSVENIPFCTAYSQVEPYKR